MVNPINRNNDPEEEIKRATEQKRKAPPKDFSEALDQVDARKQQPQEEEGLNKELKGPKKTASSSFLKKKEGLDGGAPLMSPFDLAKGVKKPIDEEVEEVIFSAEDVAAAPPMPKMKEKPFAFDESPLPVKQTSAFEAIEQPDINTVNPQGYVQAYVPPTTATTSIQPVETKAPAIPVPRPIHEIMNDIVRQIDVLKADGKTETTIDLKGTFNNSRLIITQFDSDKNAMNITIDNLTAANQQLLESHKATLMKNLDDINIHVHIFTASSSIELNPATLTKSDTGQPDKERNLRDGRRQNREQEA